MVVFVNQVESQYLSVIWYLKSVICYLKMVVFLNQVESQYLSVMWYLLSQIRYLLSQMVVFVNQVEGDILRSTGSAPLPKAFLFTYRQTHTYLIDCTPGHESRP